MTIGDVLAAITVIFALGATWAATLLLISLAFPTRAALARKNLAASPGICLARGAGVVLIVALAAAALGKNPVGPMRLLAGVLWGGLSIVAALGSAGIAKLLGERIQDIGARMSPFASLTRGVILYVLAGFLPIVGWFLIAPAALLLSVGAGVAVLGRQSDRPKSTSPSVAVGSEAAEAVA